MKILLILLLLLNLNLFAQDNTKKVIIGNLNISKFTKTNQKEAIEAIKYALLLSGKYELTSQQEIDVAQKKLESQPVMDQGPINIAIETKSDELLFVGINQFIKMIRVDVAFVNISDTSQKKLGYGYELISILEKNTDKPLIFPSLVIACQRAIAAAIDSNLYENVEEKRYKVSPVPSLVIGGLTYQNEDTLEKWDIFDKKVLSSYDAVENIFASVYKSGKYSVYDIDTRDSIYALFGFHGVENYNAPTNIEIETLRRFQVDFVITGEIKRIERGAEIKLYLIRIKDEDYIIENESKTLLIHDSQEEFGLTIQFLTSKLLGII